MSKHTKKTGNDYPTGPQGKQWLALLNVTKSIGKADCIDILSDGELQNTRQRAGVDSLKAPATIRDNLRKAKLLDDQGLLTDFVGSPYDYDQHPAYFAKLASFRPDLARILLDRGAPRMKYEMLVSLADHEQLKKQALDKFRDGFPSGHVVLALKVDGEFIEFGGLDKTFEQWVLGPKG